MCVALGLSPRWAGLARIPAVVGTGAALGTALWLEGLNGGGVGGSPVPWPQGLNWLGEPLYRSDLLSAGLGAWCLLLGALCLLRIGVGESAPWQLAVSVLTVAVLYSVVHTHHLLALAGQALLLALLVWAHNSWQGAGDLLGAARHMLAMGLGALCLVGAVLLVGRVTGGAFSLVGLSLSALEVWTLVLLALFVVLWLGMAPALGWSAQGHGGAHGALVQALLLGVPPITLILRLEALVSAQSLAGTVPPEWSGFSSALVGVGSVTAVVAAAGMVVWSGALRWTALLTAHTLALVVWALGIDSPSSRLAALAIFLAFGLGRVAITLSPRVYNLPGWARLPRLLAMASLGSVPLTPGFVGVWLLAAALVSTGRPALAVLLVGAVVLAASGAALQLAAPRSAAPEPHPPYVGWAALAAAGLIVMGGMLPAWWLIQAERMASIAGGASTAAFPWMGIGVGDGLLPVLLLALGAGIVAVIGWLIVVWARSGTVATSVLLPTALERLEKRRAQAAGDATPAVAGPLSNPASPIWWLSLAWLESGVWGFGALLARLAVSFGRLVGRLEGRFYLPLALILILITLLIVTR
jgi:hypothetical protein